MHLLVFSFVILVSFGHSKAWGQGDFEKYGLFQLSLKLISCNHDKSLNVDVSGIRVYFHDFTNNIEMDFPINESAPSILSIPKLDISRKFHIFVGGYKSSIKENIETRVRETFRKLRKSYLIIIDHSPYTNSTQGLKVGYERAVTNVFYIGNKLAQLLTGLHNGGIPANNIHCIGHSLGSHILGHAGVSFTNATGHKIQRITAIDPAGPCFSNSLIEEQIRSGVAEYVEIYHCNAGGFGTSSVLGDVDFFVNKGHSQPNCGTPLFPDLVTSAVAAQCSHNKCVTIWLSSVTHRKKFKAYKCNNYDRFMSKKCLRNDKTTAGFWNPGTATGVYYFSTKERYEYD